MPHASLDRGLLKIWPCIKKKETETRTDLAVYIRSMHVAEMMSASAMI